MTEPTRIPPSAQILPWILAVAPAVAVAGALLGGAGGGWWLIGAALLPPAGLVMLSQGYGAEVERAHRYVARLATTTSREPVAVPPESAGFATGLISAVARIDRANRVRQEELASRLSSSEAILEAMADPLILVGADRKVHRVNRAARELMGEDVTGQDLSAGLRHPELLGAVDAVLAGRAARVVEFSKSGTVENSYLARISPFQQPVRPEAGVEPGPPMAILTLHDVSAIKASEQLRADFVANASHELRTPLASLIGFIETLRGPAREDSEARERFLAIMHDQATRMSRLVDDLMSLSRIEMDEHTAPTDKVDLLHCVNIAVAAFELKAAARRVRLVVQAAPDLPAVRGDADQIVQVLHNLVGNAIKFTREQSDVTIALRLADIVATGGHPPPPLPGRRGRPPAFIALAVTDQGDGIARQHLPRLTERFYRVDPARSRALGGTGLGLAIVKHILNRHRGRLTIESELTRGTTATAWLPL